VNQNRCNRKQKKPAVPLPITERTSSRSRKWNFCQSTPRCLHGVLTMLHTAGLLLSKYRIYMSLPTLR